MPSRSPFVPPDQEASHVLDTLADDLYVRSEQLVTAELQKLVDTYLRWGERYADSMADLEHQYLMAANRLRERMTDLGCV